ncbi:hypothetical protein HOK00_00180 [bacterium]|jgi:hypothetical protein|nr:hypothetical protein [bacterium]
MNIQFANSLRVKLEDVPPEIEKLLQNEIPLHIINSEMKESDFRIKFKKKINTNTKYLYISLLALFDNNNLYLLDHKGNKFLYSPYIKDFYVEENFNSEYFFEIFEYIFMNKILENDLMFLHSSALKYNDKTIVFPACNNTGKTKVLLEFLDDGATFLGDDWCIIDKESNISPFFRNIRLYPNDIIEHKNFIKDWRVIPSFIHNYFDDSKEVKFLRIFKKIYEKILLRTRILPYKVDVKEYSYDISINNKYKADLIVFYSRNNLSKIEHEIMNSEIAARKMIYAIFNENTKKPDFENWFLFANETAKDLRTYMEDQYFSIMKSAFSKSKVVWLQIPRSAKPKDIKKYLLDEILSDDV